jgi:hypothetical protein
MPFATKKPVTIEYYVFEDFESAQDIMTWAEKYGTWMNYYCDVDECCGEESPTLVIDTLEGKMKGRSGDFIIRGVNNEFYPCKPDIFAKTYDIKD